MNSSNDLLLEVTDLRIEGFSEDRWHQIVKGVDFKLHRGEILGLIGESGAGKSTIGVAAMGYAKPGCRINGGSIVFDGIELTSASEEQKRQLRGARIAYVAQSAAASFNPAHKLIDQFSETVVQHGVGSREQAYADAKELYAKIRMPDPDTIGIGCRFASRCPHAQARCQAQDPQLDAASDGQQVACLRVADGSLPG